MKGLADRPLVCVAIAFAGGIALGAAFGGVSLWPVVACAAAALGVAIWRRSSFWAGAALLSIAALAGLGALVASETQSGSDVSGLPEGGQTLIGTVAAPPGYIDGVWRFVLAVQGHDSGSRIDHVGGQVYVRLTSTREVRRGERWRLTGRLRPLREQRNPGGQSEAARLSPLGVTAILTVGGEPLAQHLGRGEMPPVTAHAYAAQRGALSMLARYVPGPFSEMTAAVAASVIYGVHATPLPAEISDAFRKAGTIHLLVVSGSMVSMVFGFVFLPGALGAGWRRLRADRQIAQPLSGRGRVRRWPGPVAAVLGIAVVIYYATLTEGGQAVIRAAIMGVCVGLALLLRRVPAIARNHGLNIDHYTLLGIAALIILATQPSALFQPGFQLSFAAVWSLIYLTPKLDAFMPGLPRWLKLCIAGTTAAQFATFPILVWHYGQAPLGGLGANLIAIPLASIVLAAGMATCALGVIAPPVAFVPGWITGIATRGLIWVSAEFAGVPWLSPQVTRPNWIAIVAWYAGLVWVGAWLGRMGERNDHSS
jgi:competence protein ComEC